mmetsp:Transcript_3558/g.4840  ORF Transcript_3558/g.4840 Transcript_3558/m.4840 type:complete len:101 (-) Transcript_3558:185-487(-)
MSGPPDRATPHLLDSAKAKVRPPRSISTPIDELACFAWGLPKATRRLEMLYRWPVVDDDGAVEGVEEEEVSRISEGVQWVDPAALVVPSPHAKHVVVEAA